MLKVEQREDVPEKDVLSSIAVVDGFLLLLQKDVLFESENCLVNIDENEMWETS